MTDSDWEAIETRLQAFSDHVNSMVERSAGGRYRFTTNNEIIQSEGGNFVFGRAYLLPDHLEYHQLSREALIDVAKYLTDAIIRPSTAISTTFDHFRYWSWTAAVAAPALREREEENVTILKKNFQTTVHLALLPSRVDRALDNPTLEAIHWDRDRLVLMSGLSLLKRFICHLGDILTPEGRTQEKIQRSWKSKENDDSTRTIRSGSNVINYHDIIQIWLNYDAGQRAARVLSEINDMVRYDEDTLKWKFEDLSDTIEREEKDRTHNFLNILAEHRNLNSHAQTSTHALAPLTLTLCCLFLWDLITDEDHITYAEEVTGSLRMVSRTKSNLIHPLWPSAFYPIRTPEAGRLP